MDQLEFLELALGQLQDVIGDLDDRELDAVTNCAPWTVRQLASHALNNQLLWASVITAQQIVSVEDTMGGVPHEGDLVGFAEETVGRVLEMWRTAGVLESIHTTPFGKLPGSVVITFPTIDALAHAWDLSASVGRAVEFPSEAMPATAALFAATCTDDVRALGLIAAATEPPPDATDTERLMALAGRTVPR